MRCSYNFLASSKAPPALQNEREIACGAVSGESHFDGQAKSIFGVELEGAWAVAIAIKFLVNEPPYLRGLISSLTFGQVVHFDPKLAVILLV